ncbi:hypothetical protein Q1695_003869 [Nippostrongylus brasiliensis]|nr:hypothetical protein Q1695_003869 [Nippostrongylus brasiliensis]
MGIGQSAHQQKKEKVERLFRQNVRSSRSRSLDVRSDRVARPVGASSSARFHRNRCRLVEDGANGSISGLSQDEKRMIELCWFKCTQKQLKKCTEDIFADILKQDESLLKLFNLESVPPHRVRDNEFFKSHAANFAIVLNLVVTNFNDNFERTCDALQTLGYEHVNLRPRGFQMMYWDIFTDCFEQNRPMSFRKDAEKDAWSRMILFILRQMKIGYSRGVADKKIERLSMPIIY